MVANLRILFISSWYPSRSHVYAGAFIREQALALARRHDVRVIAPRLTRRPGWLLPADSSLDADEPAVLRPTARFAMPRRISWADAASSLLRAVLVAADELGRQGWTPDVIHGHSLLPTGWAAQRLGRALGVPVVVTEHSSFHSKPILTHSSERLVRETLLKADALIAVGPTLVAELLAVDPRCRPILIPNLVDDGFFTLPPGGHRVRDDGSLRIVGVGNLIPAKRFDVLLDVVAELNESGLRTHLTLVGRGPERAPLERKARDRGISAAVAFAGALGRTEVRDALWAADLLVHPSRRETFGIVLIEALACGLPVVATRCGGPEWIVDADSGLLVDVDDSIGLVDAIRRVADGRFSPDSSVIRRGVVDRFGLDQVAGQIEGVYRRLLAGQPARS